MTDKVEVFCIGCAKPFWVPRKLYDYEGTEWWCNECFWSESERQRKLTPPAFLTR